MKFINSFSLIGVAALVLVACKEQYEPYTPAQMESGSQFYFSNNTQTSFTLTPETTSIDVDVYRVESSAAGTAKVKVTDEKAVIVAGTTTTIDVPFASGENKSVLSIPVDMSKVAFGDSFSLPIEIVDETTQYGAASLTISAILPEPWKSLGYGDFNENWWYKDSAKVEIQQNELYPHQFRIVAPFNTICKNQGVDMEGPAEDYAFLNFNILQIGETLYDVPVTQEGLVWFPSTSTGYLHPSYNAVIYLYHPSAFVSMSAESNWLFNKVVSYQENGLPAVVQLAPMYYMSGVGGWNHTQEDDVVTIVFPGVVLKDYTIGVSYEGVLTGKDGTESIVANVSLEGPDAEEAAVVLVEGEDVEAALALIRAEDESVVYTSASGSVTLSLPEEAPAGKYTLVAVPVTEGGIATNYAVYETFLYGNVSPVMLPYTIDNFIGGISKKELFGTKWIAFATDDEGTPADREPYGVITFAEAEDIADDSDRILASGFTYGGADYFGTFTDDLYMEWYNGYIYTLENPVAGTYSSYDVFPCYVTSDAEQYTTEDYVMVAGFVDEGILAFVSAEEEDYSQIWFGAFSGDNCAGYLTCMNYILLVTPEVYEGLASAKAPKKQMAALQKKVVNMVSSMKAVRNYVEISPSPIPEKAQVIASGKVKIYGNKEVVNFTAK